MREVDAKAIILEEWSSLPPEQRRMPGAKTEFLSKLLERCPELGRFTPDGGHFSPAQQGRPDPRICMLKLQAWL